MMGLVTALGSPYRDRTFPSGTNWDDYIKWCLVAMQNDCDREAKMKLLNVATTESAVAMRTTATIVAVETPCTVARMTMTTTTTENAAATAATTTTQVNNDGAGAIEQHSLPGSASFFKAGVGFLAWALWGHIPLHNGEQMLSLASV